MPVCDVSKDTSQIGIIKLIDGDHVQMAREATGDVISPPSWGPHGRHQEL